MFDLVETEEEDDEPVGLEVEPLDVPLDVPLDEPDVLEEEPVDELPWLELLAEAVAVAKLLMAEVIGAKSWSNWLHSALMLARTADADAGMTVSNPARAVEMISAYPDAAAAACVSAAEKALCSDDGTVAWTDRRAAASTAVAVRRAGSKLIRGATPLEIDASRDPKKDDAHAMAEETSEDWMTEVTMVEPSVAGEVSSCVMVVSVVMGSPSCSCWAYVKTAMTARRRIESFMLNVVRLLLWSSDVGSGVVYV